MSSRSFRPTCVPLVAASRYRRKVVRGIAFDGQTLTLDVQGEGFSYARVIFRDVFGFRVLNERDLTEYWNTYSAPNGWLWEVTSGGWYELERQRDTFNPGDFVSRLREFFVVDDKCVNVLCRAQPEIVDFGDDPLRERA